MSLRRLGLLGLALLLALGHVCALPVHAETPLERSTHSTSHDADADGAHFASCDAALATCPAPAVGVTPPAPAPAAERGAAVPRRSHAEPVSPAERPPLFLLHASLLV